ncbi:conserved hypothetical protein [uncultured Dysgonomonas sp.]|uniref:Rad50/SbcC-type AAA domain-containing protein n=1 Tax=uncultured Dysgonomonas sp. TaxID=206096 RepID=A0A212IV93_9BACT|nr:DUF3732 domain-containing protein [uncultured Dysgonomonas sp.]SBV91104.1 conserved hypothetical protein [uncultured Dysgonomonas sp.]
MQIKNIILYKNAEQVRVLPFELGKVNIITGESKSGKTALIDIVDYCLGSKHCKIADGVIKNSVYWFAITVVFNDKEEYVIARLNPSVRQVSSVSEIYIEKAGQEPYPSFDNIHNNSNTDGLKEFLSRKLEIAENLQIAEGNTREPLEVNFRHARLYSFQPQTLIAQRDYLFYKQTEPFMPQAIKDSLPYFLGAIREDGLKVEQEIARKKRDLNRLVREKNEVEKIKADGISKAFSLIEEAKQIGILEKQIVVDTVSDAIKTLNSLKDWEYKDSIEVRGENSALKELLSKRNDNRIELGKLDDTISATEAFIKNNFSYSEEVEQQKIRLESINLFQEGAEDNKICPLCSSALSTEIPQISSINASLQKLKQNLEETSREKPRLNEYLQGLKNSSEKLKEEIAKAENAITALYEEQENARRLRDLNLRRGKVIGRISLFLESLDLSEDKSLDKKIASLRSEIDDLLLLVDKESKEDKMASIINRINLQMSNWVQKLDVEHEDSLIRFDMSKLTLIADTATKSIPLFQMGSGANWVSYHLLIHFALHQYFIQANRPVPRFLMIDQPTQVYFPPEKDTNNDGVIQESSDEVAVRKMFDFIIDITDSFESNFQVIITDHAYLRSDKFEQCVRETWRNGVKLIPQEWLDGNDTENGNIPQID